MKTRPPILLLVVACLLIAAAASIPAIRWLRTDTTFEFRLRDSVSGGWVWNASMRLQDRAMNGFFQSDAGLRLYRFRRLTPGTATLRISAPGYPDVSLPLTLRRGANRLDTPIDMRGLGILGLARFLVFEKMEGGDIVGELRPVGPTGAAIINHPCMDLWVGCRVSVQVKGGVPVLEETEANPERGSELFRGQVPWTWDPAPETQFRYSVRIPGARVQEDPSPYRVIDYLVVEPDPLKITRAELSDLMARVYAIADPARAAAALDAEKDRLSYFTDSSWNVKARQE